MPNTGTVNYQSGRSGARLVDDKRYEYCQSPLTGTTQQIPFEKTQNFKQAGELYRAFSEADQTRLVNAFAGDLKSVRNSEICTIMTGFLYKADGEYGKRVAGQVNVNFAEVKRLADSYQE